MSEYLEGLAERTERAGREELLAPVIRSWSPGPDGAATLLLGHDPFGVALEAPGGAPEPMRSEGIEGAVSPPVLPGLEADQPSSESGEAEAGRPRVTRPRLEEAARPELTPSRPAAVDDRRGAHDREQPRDSEPSLREPSVERTARATPPTKENPAPRADGGPPTPEAGDSAAEPSADSVRATPLEASPSHREQATEPGDGTGAAFELRIVRRSAETREARPGDDQPGQPAARHLEPEPPRQIPSTATARGKPPETQTGPPGEAKIGDEIPPRQRARPAPRDPLAERRRRRPSGPAPSPASAPSCSTNLRFGLGQI